MFTEEKIEEIMKFNNDINSVDTSKRDKALIFNHLTENDYDISSVEKIANKTYKVTYNMFGLLEYDIMSKKIIQKKFMSYIFKNYEFLALNCFQKCFNNTINEMKNTFNEVFKPGDTLSIPGLTRDMNTMSDKIKFRDIHIVFNYTVSFDNTMNISLIAYLRFK